MATTFKSVAKEICKREGKKKQVDIAQVSEILKIVRELCVQKPGVRKLLAPTMKPMLHVPKPSSLFKRKYRSANAKR